MEGKLELIVLPVSDIDRAKAFYTDKLDFNLDEDHRAGDFRVVQLTPRGSSCSISTVSRNASPAGSTPVKGRHLVVPDIEGAHAELGERGAETSEIYHLEAGRRVPGPDPARARYGSFFSLADLDGNGWMVEEVRP